MPETSNRPRPEPAGTTGRTDGAGQVTDRVHAVRDGLAVLLEEARRARAGRAEAAGADGAVCAWNHFENIPTFYNWNNRPR